MSVNQKAVPGAATPGNGQTGNEQSSHLLPRMDYNTRHRPRQEQNMGRSPSLAFNLFARCHEAVSAEEAARRYGIDTERGMAHCVYHDDRHPSMAFRNGRFNCWACGAHGDSIDLTAKLFHLTPIDAVRKLNDDFDLGLPLDRSPSDEELAHEALRRLEADHRRQAEAMRVSLIRNLNAAYRVGHFALISGRPWTGQEALAVKWMSALEYWSNLLDGPDKTAQKDILDHMEELSKLCIKILK